MNILFKEIHGVKEQLERLTPGPDFEKTISQMKSELELIHQKLDKCLTIGMDCSDNSCWNYQQPTKANVQCVNNRENVNQVCAHHEYENVEFNRSQQIANVDRRVTKPPAPSYPSFSDHLTNPMLIGNPSLLMNTLANQFGVAVDSPELIRIIQNQPLFMANRRTFANLIWDMSSSEEAVLTARPSPVPEEMKAKAWGKRHGLNKKSNLKSRNGTRKDALSVKTVSFKF
ncbi:hypothetical protein ACOME3_005597 [Neoechinorhynchus agilis]